MDLVIVLSTQGAQCNMLAPSSCKGPSTHSCLNIYLRHEGGGGAAVAAAAAKREEKGSEICVFVRASDCVI